MPTVTLRTAVSSFSRAPRVRTRPGHRPGYGGRMVERSEPTFRGMRRRITATKRGHISSNRKKTACWRNSHCAAPRSSVLGGAHPLPSRRCVAISAIYICVAAVYIYICFIRRGRAWCTHHRAPSAYTHMRLHICAAPPPALATGKATQYSPCASPHRA